MYRRMRIDVLICLGLAMLAAIGTGKLAEMVSALTYDSYVEAHTVAAGDVGGPAGEDIFRAQSVDDLLAHETFTVLSHGIEYRNRGGGYYGGAYYHLLTLPSGERIAARINEDGVQELGDSYYTSDKVLPVGRLVWEDLTSSETFLDQIQHSEPLSRTDCYIDMMGHGGAVNLEDYVSFPANVVQVVTVVVLCPLLHILGARVGIFPYLLPPRKKKKKPVEEPWES